MADYLPQADKPMVLKFNEMEKLRQVAHALSNEQRLRILYELGSHSLNINELANALELPVSSIAAHVNVLEAAGLIQTRIQTGKRGNVKNCMRTVYDINMDLHLHTEKNGNRLERRFDIPIGAYSKVGDVVNPCGMIIDHQRRYQYEPEAYYMPDHHQAQLIWFAQGYIEYLLPLPSSALDAIDYISLSFEACSETSFCNNNWPSDIEVCLNDCRLGVWRSPGDFGLRPGVFTPKWWMVTNTQFGQLHNWTINRQGCFFDTRKTADYTIEDLHLEQAKYLKLKIGVYTGNGIAGGLNLFGENFGDYAQGIILKYGYRETVSHKQT